MSLTALIPKMTGYTAPSGVASASSEYATPLYAAWRALSQASTDSWISADGTHPLWLQYQFSAVATPTHYALVTNTNNAWVPTAWDLQGSNNGADWTTLDSQTAQGTALFMMYAIPPANVGAYTYFRLNFTAGSAVFDAINSFQLYAASTATDPNKVLTPDGNATLPAAGNVLTGTGTYGNPTAPVTPTSDKLYSSAEEITRNEIPTLSLIPTAATGGPAAWLQRNVSRVGTLDLDAEKLAFETGRNNDNGTVANDIVIPASVKIRNTTITGTNPGGSLPLGFDPIYWELVGGLLSPRNPPKAINYPAAGHVRTPDIFGYDNQFTGTEVLPAIGDVRSGIGYGTAGIEFFGTITGNFITPAKVAAEDNRDGSHATFTVWNTPHATAVNAVYVAQFLSSGPQSWALVGTVVGNGSFIVPLAAVEYQVKVQTTYSGGVGVYIGNTFWISNVASRRRALLRDRTAFAAMRVAHRLGRKIWVRNLGYTAVEVWCTCEGGFESLSLLGGETSATRFTLWIPRQTGMPMAEGFKPGMTCWVEDIPFACQITYDAELPLWAPVFRADCTRYDITVELDGLEVPTHGP